MGTQGKISLAEDSSSVTGLPPGATSLGPKLWHLQWAEMGSWVWLGGLGQGGVRSGVPAPCHELRGALGDLSAPSLGLQVLTIGLSELC